MADSAAPDRPVQLATMGSFTVSGREVRVSGLPAQEVALSGSLSRYGSDPNGTHQVEHAYVQYVVPAQQRGLPVVLVHGGGMTGSCWESTPDGRTGWVWHFLRAGHPVYVVDNVERGRAGWNPVAGATSEHPPMVRPAEEAWAVFRIGPPEGYPDRPYADGRFPPGHVAELCRMLVPRWTTTTGLAVAAVEALVARVGRCALIGHSQGGGIAAHAAARRPAEVAALVLLEPHGLPVPPEPVAPAPHLVVAGDFIDPSPLYTGLRATWLDHLTTLTAAGHRGDLFDLPAMGHPGNSHMIMMDGNSDTVATLVDRWIEEVAGTS